MKWDYFKGESGKLAQIRLEQMVVPVPEIMDNKFHGKCDQAILRFCLRSLRGCNAGNTIAMNL
jgi:hypothetical protein